MAGLVRVRRGIGRLLGRHTRKALVLLYHRAAGVGSDPQMLAVSTRHFVEHLAILRSQAHPMALPQLANDVQQGSIPERAVCVTFDDGYADFLTHALPLLEQYDIPVTVFVATGYLGCRDGFWWDSLHTLLLQPGRLPETVRLTVNGTEFEWVLGDSACYTRDDYERDQSWNVRVNADWSPRHRVYRQLHRVLRSVTDGERRRVLDTLKRMITLESERLCDNVVLSHGQLADLGNRVMCDIGAHTVNHPVLSTCTVERQRQEIGESKACLEEIIGRPVTAFAYPFGAMSDYTNVTVNIVRELGFHSACSNIPGAVWRGDDPFQLPRALVRDCDGATFAKHLEGWFRG